MKSLNVLALACSFGLLLGATGTLAGPAKPGIYDERQLTLAIDDLDLTSRDDAQTLVTRIHAAALKVCRRSGAGWHQQDRFHVDRDRCRAAAYDAGVARIDAHFNIDLEAVAGITQDNNSIAAAR